MWLTTLLPLVALAGGGGSFGGGGGGGFSGGSSYSGGGSGGDDSSSSIGTAGSIFIFIAIIVGVIFFISFSSYVAYKAKLARDAKKAQMGAAVTAAAATDNVWQQDKLTALASETFIRYQKDWSDFNLDSMKSYMTPAYYQRNLLMMGALKLINRKNQVDITSTPEVSLDSLEDDANNARDWFKAEISAMANDELTDTRDNTTLFFKSVKAVEQYRFVRSGNDWLFDGIDQLSADASSQNKAIEAFAQKNGYFYSLDWGHLLLPANGQIFSSGSFGVSDINNHVIGLVDDTIVQLYSYVANPGMSYDRYIVAQVAVPKSYGNIVVRRRGSSLGRKRKLKEVKTEWDEFNKKYEVWASTEEQATSFELLNPLFMVNLEALPFEVNIEVVDNVVYLYAKEEASQNNAEYYEQLLVILKAAHKEMRM